MASNKQRRAAERRRLHRQLQRRRQRAASRRRTNLIISIVGTLVLVAAVITLFVATTGGNGTSAAGGTTSPTPTPTSPAASSGSATAAAYPCTWTSSGTSAVKGITPPATTRPPRSGKVAVSVTTNRGPLGFTLDRSPAPCTVASFVSLVKQGYYDKTPCHRLVTQGIYVLQCGDPTGTGSGGPGYTIPDEATGSETYPAGTIAMARTSQAHSGGSQFFIVYRNSPTLQQHLGAQQYTVFGRVATGLGVVRKVAKAGVAPGGQSPSDGTPKLPITLRTLSLAH